MDATTEQRSSNRCNPCCHPNFLVLHQCSFQKTDVRFSVAFIGSQVLPLLPALTACFGFCTADPVLVGREAASELSVQLAEDRWRWCHHHQQPGQHFKTHDNWTLIDIVKIVNARSCFSWLFLCSLLEWSVGMNSHITSYHAISLGLHNFVRYHMFINRDHTLNHIIPSRMICGVIRCHCFSAVHKVSHVGTPDNQIDYIAQVQLHTYSHVHTFITHDQVHVQIPVCIHMCRYARIYMCLYMHLFLHMPHVYHINYVLCAGAGWPVHTWTIWQILTFMSFGCMTIGR